MNNFCTLFDKNYLTRGLALIESLTKHLEKFTLYILCLDHDGYNFLHQFNNPNVQLIRLEEIEETYNELQTIKSERSIIEYYFTLSPYLPLYILKRFPENKFICSLDADIYFFNSPKKIFAILEQKSIVITPHKYATVLKHIDIRTYGKYNVSFQIFKNNEVGLRCLEQWRQQCFEWCFDELDEINNRYADQKYLDTWLEDFPGEVHILNEPDTGLAIWNIDNYRFSLKGGEILVNDKYPLIFYHFHHFKIVRNNLALNGFGLYNVKNPSKILTREIYFVYWKALLRQELQVSFNSDNSLRHNYNHSPLKLLKIHKTGFVRIANSILKVNLTFVRPLGKIIKNINVLFTRF